MRWPGMFRVVTIGSCAGAIGVRALIMEVVEMRTSHSDSNQHDQRRVGTGRRSRWSRILGGNPVALSVTAASAWALVIAVFASVSRMFGPEGERGTWAEVLQAVIGNFVVALVVALAVTLAVRAFRRRHA